MTNRDINDALWQSGTSQRIRREVWDPGFWIEVRGEEFISSLGCKTHLSAKDALATDWMPWNPEIEKQWREEQKEKEREKERAQWQKDLDLAQRGERHLAGSPRCVTATVGILLEKYQRLLEWAKSCPESGPHFADFHFERGNWINRGMTLIKELEQK